MNKDGLIAQWAQEIVDRLDSYTEISPSGHGVHIIVKASKPGPSCRGGYKDGEVEMYSEGRYFTVTGRTLDSGRDTIEYRQKQINQLYDMIFQTDQSQLKQPPLQKSQFLSDKALVEKAGSAKNGQKFRALMSGDLNGYRSQSEADQALCNMLAFWTGRDAQLMDNLFRQSGLMRPKWDRSAGQGQTYGQRTIDKAIASCVEIYNPDQMKSQPPGNATNIAIGDKENRQGFTRKELADRIEAVKGIKDEGYTDDDYEELTGLIARDVTLSNLLPSHMLSLRKLIAKKTGVSVASLVADAEGYQPLQASNDMLHLEAAREVIKFYGQENILDFIQFCWQWNGAGLWVKLDDREIKQRIHNIAGAMDLTKNIVDSILDMVKTEIFKPGHQFDIDRSAINCRNGELRWDASEWLLEPHRREHYRTTQIPVEYESDASAPRFEQFLDEIFRGDGDKADKKKIILEGIGYSLLSSCEFEKFFLLIGPGANGKSVLMDTLAALVGRENVCAVQPSQFENRFQRAHLHCKLVNLVTEIAEGHEIADAQLKAIVSGELTTAEHKHKNPFDFQPFCTCWFGTNHMPHTRDFSDALFRRAIIITFNRTFKEEEQDNNLKEKLRAELPGILNLALSAVGGVFNRGEFTKAASCEKAKREWRHECDQVAQFAEDECVFGAGYKRASKELYMAYEQWARDSGIKRILNHKNFTTRFVRLGVQTARGSGGTRMLVGVDLKNLFPKTEI
jgi:P4 family phage/plasmid primase-like protien